MFSFFWCQYSVEHCPLFPELLLHALASKWFLSYVPSSLPQRPKILGLLWKPSQSNYWPGSVVEIGPKYRQLSVPNFFYLRGLVIVEQCLDYNIIIVVLISLIGGSLKWWHCWWMFAIKIGRELFLTLLQFSCIKSFENWLFFHIEQFFFPVDWNSSNSSLPLLDLLPYFISYLTGLRFETVA